MAEELSAYKELISKPEINFWVPIIVSIVSVSLVFASMRSDVKAAEVKVDTAATRFETGNSHLSDKMDELLNEIQSIKAETETLKLGQEKSAILLDQMADDLTELKDLHQRTN